MAFESSIVKSILNYLNSQPNSIAEKVAGTSSNSGKADINGCYHGHSFRFEIKTSDHGNKASVKQEVNLKRWKAAGAICAVCYTLEEVKKALKEGMEDAKD